MGEIEAIKKEETYMLKMVTRCVDAARRVMEQLRNHVLGNSFRDQSEEIYFFKTIKPLFFSSLKYHVQKYRYESRVPAGSLKAKVKFFATELKKIDDFFESYVGFFQYYRSGATFLDEMYFVRGNQSLELDIDAHLLNVDPAFSTGYDALIARFLANEQLSSDLNNAMRNAHEQERSDEQASGPASTPVRNFVQTGYRASEVYAFLRALIDADGSSTITINRFLN